MSKNRDLIRKHKQVNVAEVSLPVAFHHAEGARLFDHDGNSFLDFTSGYGVVSTGWLRKEIANVIQKQLQIAAYAPPWLPTNESIQLSELLLKLTPDNLVKCVRASGGADANEIIFKAVYQSSGKRGIISFNRSYHGGTYFTLNISDSKSFRLPRLPAGGEFHFVDPPYCFRCPYGKEPTTCNLECTKPIEALLETDETIGCFYLEPVPGSGGVIVPPEKYFRKVRALCDRYHVYMVFDEVLTGFGRLGAITASKLFNIKPDAISFAKGMSGGYAAIGAVVLNEELSKAMKNSEDVSASFSWTPLSCAIAKANIELILSEQLPENADSQGRYLLQKLTCLFQAYFPLQNFNIRGLGLMIGIEPVTDLEFKRPDFNFVKRFIITALKQKLMVCASWDLQVIILMPPLNITRSEIDEGLSIIESTLQMLTIAAAEIRSEENVLPSRL